MPVTPPANPAPRRRPRRVRQPTQPPVEAVPEAAPPPVPVVPKPGLPPQPRRPRPSPPVARPAPSAPVEEVPPSVPTAPIVEDVPSPSPPDPGPIPELATEVEPETDPEIEVAEEAPEPAIHPTLSEDEIDEILNEDVDVSGGDDDDDEDFLGLHSMARRIKNVQEVVKQSPLGIAAPVANDEFAKFLEEWEGFLVWLANTIRAEDGVLSLRLPEVDGQFAEIQFKDRPKKNDIGFRQRRFTMDADGNITPVTRQ